MTTPTADHNKSKVFQMSGLNSTEPRDFCRRSAEDSSTFETNIFVLRAGAGALAHGDTDNISKPEFDVTT